MVISIAQIADLNTITNKKYNMIKPMILGSVNGESPVHIDLCQIFVLYAFKVWKDCI